MKFDMHVHTKYSLWAYSEMKDIVKYAEKAGLDGIAICDHDTLKGVKEFKKIKTDLKLIPGIEITAKGGDILAYGVNELIPKGLSPEETIEKIHQQGAVAFAAHPFSFVKGIGKRVMSMNFDGYEVFNAKASKNANNTALLTAAEMHAAMTAGSDSHQPVFIGKAYSIFEGDFFSAVKSRKMCYFGEYVSYSKIIKEYIKNIGKFKVILSRD